VYYEYYSKHCDYYDYTGEEHVVLRSKFLVNSRPSRATNPGGLFYLVPDEQ